MEDKIKSAEESFQIIKKMIENEKIRFNENGFVYLFWGWLAIASTLLQFVLFFAGYEKNYYAWFLMLLGGIYMFFYYRNKKERTSMPLTGKVLAYTWIFIGLNIFAFAFLFSGTAYHLILFFILTLLGLGSIVSGALIRFPLLIFGGIGCNILAFISIYLQGIYWWGILTIVAVLIIDIFPGYILRSKYRQNHV